MSCAYLHAATALAKVIRAKGCAKSWHMGPTILWLWKCFLSTVVPACWPLCLAGKIPTEEEERVLRLVT